VPKSRAFFVVSAQSDVCYYVAASVRSITPTGCVHLMTPVLCAVVVGRASATSAASKWTRRIPPLTAKTAEEDFNFGAFMSLGELSVGLGSRLAYAYVTASPGLPETAAQGPVTKKKGSGVIRRSRSTVQLWAN
jgi:hypothetical protein